MSCYFATLLQINWTSLHRSNWLLRRTTSHSCDELAQFLQRLERNFAFTCIFAYKVSICNHCQLTFGKTFFETFELSTFWYLDGDNLQSHCYLPPSLAWWNFLSELLSLSFLFFIVHEQSGNISHNNAIGINLWCLTVSFCALTLLVLLWREYLQALTGCMPGMIKSKTSSFFCLTQRERFVDKIDLERSVGNCIEGEVVEKYCSWLVSHRGHCHHPAQWIES